MQSVNKFVLSPQSIQNLKLAEEEHQRRIIEGPIVPFIPYAFPGRSFEAPTHLEPFAQVLQRAFYTYDRVRAGVSIPPQHGKTLTIVGAIAQAIARDPRIRIGLASYRARYAQSRSLQVLRIVQQLGVPLDPKRQAGSEWHTAMGGHLIAGGLDHGFTGQTLDVVIVDDPYDGRAAAESTAHRQAVEEFIIDTLQPRSRSIIIDHARWHPDDAIGTRSQDPDWQIVNLPAECENPSTDPLQRPLGAPLWPNRPQSLGGNDFTESKKDAYTWASLFQGRPRPRGGRVFEHAPVFYQELPRDRPVMYGIGWDLAYSAKKQSDWSVIVVLALIDEMFYVVDVKRWQSEITQGRAIINQTCSHYPGVVRFGWTGGQELGIVQLLNEKGQDESSPGAGLVAQSASGVGDKFIRAQPVSISWNEGKVLIPRKPHAHIPEFLRVVSKFTGHGDLQDDDVDALAAAYHALRPYIKRKSMFDGLPKLRVWRK